MLNGRRRTRGDRLIGAERDEAEGGRKETAKTSVALMKGKDERGHNEAESDKERSLQKMKWRQ